MGLMHSAAIVFSFIVESPLLKLFTVRIILFFLLNDGNLFTLLNIGILGLFFSILVLDQVVSEHHFVMPPHRNPKREVKNIMINDLITSMT